MTEDDEDATPQDQDNSHLRNEDEFRRRAAEIYSQYAGPLKSQFRWLRPDRFQTQLAEDLKISARIALLCLRCCISVAIGIPLTTLSLPHSLTS